MITRADWVLRTPTPLIIKTAALIGAGIRGAENAIAGTNGRGGQPPGIHADAHIDGVLTEIMAGEYLRLPVTGLYDRGRRDLDDFAEVRSTRNQDWGLILANDPDDGPSGRVDAPDAPFIMCVVEPAIPPTVVYLVGWLLGKDGMIQEQYGTVMGGRPRFFVPFKDLHPMSTLKIRGEKP